MITSIASLSMTSPFGSMNQIGSIGSIANSGINSGVNGATRAADGDSGFAAMLSNALDNLQQTQAVADQLATQAATGDLNAVQDYTIAATEAQLLTQLTVEVRNRAVEAFNDIMRMQV